MTMSIYQIRDAMMWCSLINLGLLTVMWLIMIKARAWAFRIHSKMFPITEPQFNMAIYSFFGLYKVLIFVFNIIPWVVLSIMT